MNRSFKKFIAFVLAVALCLQLAVVPENEALAATASDFDKYGNSYEGYNGNETDLVIPYENGVTNLSLYGTTPNCENIKSITIPDGFTEVYLGCFDNLEKIVLPKTVKRFSISGCAKLKQLSVPQNCSFVDIYLMDALETVTIGKTSESDAAVIMTSCDSLKELSIGLGYDSFDINGCEKLEKINTPDSLLIATLYNLPSLKKVTIPDEVYYLYVNNVPFSAIDIKTDAYEIVDGGLYDCRYSTLCAIDSSAEVINVKKGTLQIDCLCLSDAYYKVNTINLPDTVEGIGDYAFDGGTNLKTVNIPKSVLTIGSYAFRATAISELTVPKNVRFVRENVFAGYEGKIKLGKGMTYLTEYKDGIYKDENYDTGYEEMYQLIYYPKNKKTIDILLPCVGFDSTVFMGSKITELTVPGHVMYLDLDLSGSSLTTLNISDYVRYIDSETFSTAHNLKKLTVDPENSFYASYKNCLYSKDMSVLLGRPEDLEVVEIHKDCVSAANWSLSAYHYDPYDESERYSQLTVYFPKDFVTADYMDVYDMRVYAGSEMAQLIENKNAEEAYWAELYGWETVSEQKYQLRDTTSELFDLMYVVDEISVKKGKKKTAEVTAPVGLNIVKKLTKKNNTEVSVKFSSSNKQIAKVNSTSGVVKGVKKGKCTITVTCTIIADGKKKETKKFKIPVTVK